MTKAFFGDAGPTIVPPATGPIPVQQTPPAAPRASRPAAVTPPEDTSARFTVAPLTRRFDDASVRRIFARHTRATG